jgi:DNA-binding transcriptional ArsR family regulator
VLDLVDGEKSLTALSMPMNMTMPAVMKHIAVLENAGIITSEKRGRTRYCKLRPERLTLARDWIDETTAFWTNRLEALAKHLEEPE